LTEQNQEAAVTWLPTSVIGKEEATMSRRTQVLTLCAVILTLCGGCERQEPAQGKAEEQQMPGTPGA
jgi:hypothetical protein